MALKLKVHWREEHLQVDLHREIAKIRTSRSPHVRTVGNDVVVENFFRVKNKVHDVSRYRINTEGRCVLHDDIPEPILKQKLLQQPQIRNIVLLLESPHKDEYKKDKVYKMHEPQGPGKGPTGTNITRCLDTVLSNIKAELVSSGLNEAELVVPNSHVIISNPIPFQTSLYCIHKAKKLGDNYDYKWSALRDFVWLTLWGEPYIQRCFRARLNRYNPSLIVNACTGYLKSSVKDFVREKLPNVTLYEAHHPSHPSWNNCGDMGLVRIYPPDNPTP